MSRAFPKTAAVLVLLAATLTMSLSADAQRDGQHDFDFDIGNWHTHSSRLLHPLTGSTTWVELDGVTIVKPVWGGRANLAEFKADGSEGHL